MSLSSVPQPTVYTPENPRRSRRLADKPTVKYITEEDEIYEAIEAVCAKKGYEFSEDLITEFNAWYPSLCTVTEKYNRITGKLEPMSRYEIATQWAMYYSKSLLEQKRQMMFAKAILKYCEKNGFDYNPLMDKKFSEWMADPANKKIITYTYFPIVCTCSRCLPFGTKKPDNTEYTLERSPTYCINKWFSTLKKTVTL